MNAQSMSPEATHQRDAGPAQRPAPEDYYRLDETLSEAERAIRDRVRAFADREVLPIINDYWERAEFPFELVPKLAELGIAGTSIEGYGCPGMSRLGAGIVARELARADGSLNTFFGVHSGLAMGAIGPGERRAEGPLAAGDGAAGEDRRLRSHRARARFRLGLARDQRTAHRYLF